MNDPEHDDPIDAPAPELPILIEDGETREIDPSYNAEADREQTAEALTPSEIMARTGAAFRGVLEWIGGKFGDDRPGMVRRRLRVLAMMMGQGMAGTTFKELAQSEDCTRANISALACEFRDRFNFRSPQMRNADACKNMSNAGGGQLGKTYKRGPR